MNFDVLKKIWNIFWCADMGYNTTLFWIFLIGFLGIYLLLRKPNIRKYWVLIGSVVFYIWSGVGAFVIVVGTGAVVYAITRMIEKVYAELDVEKAGLTKKEQRALFNLYKKKTQKYLALGLFLIVSLWVAVKVGKLLNYDTVESLMDLSVGRNIIVPLGISYYTLSSVGYMVDVYWRKTIPEHNFLDLFSAMIYFPHIMQGPISKYGNLMKQMKELPSVNYERVCFGLQLMLWGYFKKMVVADRIILYTEPIFVDPASYAGVEILIAIILGTIQLYADFSGCMDIVRGISQVLGIELELNFRQPFFAKSAQEFWSRWHMTLGNWTKDYIYIPLALHPKIMKGTRRLKENGHVWWSSFIYAFIPLVTVWIFTGLWHGTGWDYLLWGMYWCVLMTLGKELQPLANKSLQLLSINTEKTYYKIWQMFRTSMLFVIGRTITVTGVLCGAAVLWKRVILSFQLGTIFTGSIFTYGLAKKDFCVTILGIVVIFIVDVLHERGIEIRATIGRKSFLVRWGIYYLAIVVVLIFGMYGMGFDAASFVYGAF